MHEEAEVTAPGGQMIFFFGADMYICAVVQIGLYYDVAEYTAHYGAVRIEYDAVADQDYELALKVVDYLRPVSVAVYEAQR